MPFAEMKAAARAAGMTDTDIDAELGAHNAERRDRRALDWIIFDASAWKVRP